MSDSTALVRAMLPEACNSDGDAEAVLVAAGEAGVDPMDYCIHRYGLGAATVLQRGAHWAGFAFSPVVASTEGQQVTMRRLEGLAEARSIHARVFDRDVTYLAPRFSDLLALKAHALAHPDIRRRVCVAPPAAIRSALARFASAQLLDESRQRLSRRWPTASAHLDLGRGARFGFVAIAVALAGLAGLAPELVRAILLPPVGLVLMVPALFRLVVIATGAGRRIQAAPPLADKDLPVYSVLIPLRDEAHMVPLLQRAMTALSYPPEKLDIRFVVETGSTETIEAVRALLDDPRFELLVVPDAAPSTKPKALNYALPFVRGAHVVVYDAEDIPNPDQLRLAASRFAASPGLDCLQAELLVDNARENALTGLFAGEYAGQFGIMLPALARWGLPMPLGGTSNHFRTAALRALGGWDAFNVTEDADAGIRLARLHSRTGVLPSQTWEEAPVRLGSWMRQRTRWMKGWMQTFIVHNRQPPRLLAEMGPGGFAAFEIYVFSMILSPLLHTAFLAGLLLRPLAGEGLPFTPGDPLSLLALAVLVIGYGASFLLVGAGLLRLGQHRLLAQQLLLPLYWVLHSAATLWAAWELVTRPHFWAKTAHGLTRLERSFTGPPRA